MSLTVKQRAKVNAALCLIHDNGLDANAVSDLARNIMATGHDPRSAFERALNQFAENNPQLLPALSKMTALIEASDVSTVARYDQALASYIETGDNSALKALVPMIAEDSLALALQNGELTPEEAANGGLASALGFDPSPEFQQAIDAAKSNPTGAPNVSGEMMSTVAQVSLAGDGPGMVAPKAAGQWAERSTYQGWAPTEAPATAAAQAPNSAPASPGSFAFQ